MAALMAPQGPSGSAPAERTLVARATQRATAPLEAQAVTDADTAVSQESLQSRGQAEQQQPSRSGRRQARESKQAASKALLGPKCGKCKSCLNPQLKKGLPASPAAAAAAAAGRVDAAAAAAAGRIGAGDSLAAQGRLRRQRRAQRSLLQRGRLLNSGKTRD